MSEQSQAKHNKSGRSGNLTPTRDGKNGKPSMILGQSPNRNDTSNIKNKLQQFSLEDDDIDDEADVGASRSETNLDKYNLNDVKKITVI
jgi:hypothetical protein